MKEETEYSDFMERIGVKIDEEALMGEYSNATMVIVSPTEFILDFGTMVPGLPAPRIRRRILLSPAAAKRFAQNLQDNIRSYESTFGTIETFEQSPQATVSYNFQKKD